MEFSLCRCAECVVNVLCLVSLHRTQVKVEYLMATESSESLMEEIGSQLLNTGAYQLPDTALQAVDTITKEDVVKVSVFTLVAIASYYELQTKYLIKVTPNKQTPVFKLLQ